MKKMLIMLSIFITLLFFPLVINAKVCDYENVASFGGDKSNSTVDGQTCPNWSYDKVYSFQNDDMVAICYLHKDVKNNPMYFIDLYAADNGACKKKMSALYSNGKTFNDTWNHSSWLSFNSLNLQTVSGVECPKYMYKVDDDFLASSYDVYLTDDVNDYNNHQDSSNKFLWIIPVSTSTGGGTVEDIISEDKVISCVNSNIQNMCINNPASTESEIKSKIQDSTKACVEEARKSYGVALDQSALDRFSNNVSAKIVQSEAPKLAVECSLMKKCSALSTLKQSNPSLEANVIQAISRNNANVSTLTAMGVSQELATCLSNNAAAAQQTGQELIESTTETVGSEVGSWGTVGTGKAPTPPKIEPDPTQMNCSQILGKNLTNIVKAAITIIQIAAAIIAIVKGMITLIPAITAKDTDGLKKAEKQLVLMAIILVVIFLLKPIVSFIGGLFDYDLSCIL